MAWARSDRTAVVPLAVSGRLLLGEPTVCEVCECCVAAWEWIPQSFVVYGTALQPGRQHRRPRPLFPSSPFFLAVVLGRPQDHV